jgi:predicted RNA-binding protein with PUA-like domain
MPRKTSKRAKSPIHYWLFKTEPNVYSIDDLGRTLDQTTGWDGVRNYQARNFLRDEIQVGDRVLLYHSRVEPMAVVGSLEVVRRGYPDSTAFDEDDKHFDPKSDPEDPTWYQVDVRLLQKFPQPVTRGQMKACPDLADMMLLKRGSRLSIQPVTETEWQAVHRLAGVRE